MRLILSVFFFSFSISGITQGHNNIWYFGSYAGLDFNSVSPIAISGQLTSFGSPACISEPNGNLLFYSNGIVVWDRNHNIMPNGSGLAAGQSPAQSALIVPYPGSNYLYYLFTTEDISSDGGLSYSIIDIRLNSGLGDVVLSTKNTLVKDKTVDKVTAITHDNGKDIWVITHSFDSNEFLAYLINEQGISTTPVVTSIGSILPGNNSYGGPIKGSNSGNKLILGSTYLGIVEMFNFDKLTGHLSEFYNITPFLGVNQTIIGIEFSPNDSLLYFSIFEEGFFVNYLYQFDINSTQLTDLNNPLKANPGGLQVGPDKKIYCKGVGNGAVSVIHQPNKIGVECQFQPNGVMLKAGTTALASFASPSPYSFPLDPNFNTILGRDTFLCHGQSIILVPNFPVNCDSITFRWNDGSEESELFVDQSGIYWVQMTSSCKTYSDTIKVRFINCTPIVEYNLDSCEAYMSNGSHMDYSEFKPLYPLTLKCAEITATNISRANPVENKHSCTPGVNGTAAMCISSYNSCSYIPDHEGALVFDITINPKSDSIFILYSLEFYQRAPETYDWIHGNSGINNYPTKLALRILKNGLEIYRNINIETSLEWRLESILFFNKEEFTIEQPTVFHFEFLPYCLIGNGASVTAWDIDEIRIFGDCNYDGGQITISGKVINKNNTEINDVKIELTSDITSTFVDATYTNEYGIYLFSELNTTSGYYIKGYKNDQILNGVNVIDLLYLQKHLLGIQPFNNLFQFVAADINNNGIISVTDLVDLRKTLLGIHPGFPNNTSWRFGPLAQDMSGLDISTFVDSCHFDNALSNPQEVDLLAVKIGDISGNSRNRINIESGNSGPSDLFLNIDCSSYPGNSDSIFTLVFSSKDFHSIIGLQFALNLKGFEFIAVKDKVLKVPDDCFHYKDNSLRFIWISEEEILLHPNDTLFAIFIKRQSRSDGELNISWSLDLLPLAYSENLAVKNLNVDFSTLNFAFQHQLDFYIMPNLIESNAIIRFFQAVDGKSEIWIYDLNGKGNYISSKYYTKGYHDEEINLASMPSGLYFIHLNSSGLTLAKRLIKV